MVLSSDDVPAVPSSFRPTDPPGQHAPTRDSRTGDDRVVVTKKEIVRLLADRHNLTQVDTRGPANDLQEVTFYEYDENGVVTQASRTRFNDDGSQEESNVFFNEDGNPYDASGDVAGIRDALGPPPDPNTLTGTDPSGTRTVVRYNPNGTIDVWVWGSDGRLIALQFFMSGEYPGFPRPRVAEQPPECRTLRVGTREASVVVAVRDRLPALAALAGDVRLGGLPLCVQGVELLLEPLLGGLARVDGAANGRRASGRGEGVTVAPSSHPALPVAPRFFVSPKKR